MPVDRRRKASRPTTNNCNIVFGGTRGSLESKSACKIAHFGVLDNGAVSQSRHGTINGRPVRRIQKSHRFRGIGRQPIE